jgi:hypothetical protein
VSTKPKVPGFDVPLTNPQGYTDKEWFRALSEQAHVGDVATTATGGAGTLPAAPVGFFTVYVNGTARKVPFYNE